jgi:hypothetical protein
VEGFSNAQRQLMQDERDAAERDDRRRRAAQQRSALDAAALARRRGGVGAGGSSPQAPSGQAKQALPFGRGSPDGTAAPPPSRGSTSAPGAALPPSGAGSSLRAASGVLSVVVPPGPASAPGSTPTLASATPAFSACAAATPTPRAGFDSGPVGGDAGAAVSVTAAVVAADPLDPRGWRTSPSPSPRSPRQFQHSVAPVTSFPLALEEDASKETAAHPGHRGGTGEAAGLSQRDGGERPARRARRLMPEREAA